MNLPGLNGFVGEFLILLGTYLSKNPHAKLYAGLAATGVIFAAVYLLWMIQRVFFGPCTKSENQSLSDVSPRETFYLAVLLVFIVWIGVYPNTFLEKTRGATANFVALMEKAQAPAKAQASKFSLSQVFKGEAR